MTMLFLIVGKSASGKDTLAHALEEHGLTQVISRTDRDPRYEDEATHIFVDADTAKTEAGSAVAATEIAGHTYYALDEDIEAHDIYVVDPRGVRDLCRNMPDEVFHVVYVDADDALRKSHAIARAEDPELASKLFDERNASEAPDFEEFRLLCTDQPEALPQQVVAVTVIRNDYTPSTLGNTASRLADWKRQFEGVRHMICELSHYDLFDIDDDCHLRADIGNERVRISLDAATAVFLADDAQLASLTRSYLKQTELAKN